MTIHGMLYTCGEEKRDLLCGEADITSSGCARPNPSLKRPLVSLALNC